MYLMFCYNVFNLTLGGPISHEDVDVLQDNIVLNLLDGILLCYKLLNC